MKREHPHQNHLHFNPRSDPSMDSGSSAAGGGFLPADSSLGCRGKASKLWDEDDGGMDELLAVLGYKVRSSDMAEVAQKLEQLEEAMCSVQQDNLSQLASDTVHYNPSDLSTWLESTWAPSGEA